MLLLVLLQEESVTCQVLGELLLQLGGSVQGLPGLVLRQALVHVPADDAQVRCEESRARSPVCTLT